MVRSNYFEGRKEKRRKKGNETLPPSVVLMSITQKFSLFPSTSFGTAGHLYLSAGG